ncbi:MAG: sulfite exporter TauE/SafE family protein [Leptospirales bacterium]
MELWTLLPVGIVIATIASMLGIGGGIVWVPYLILVMDLAPKDAILLSFGIQIIGMGSAAIKYVAQRRVLWRLIFGLILFIFAGVFAGAYLSQRVADGNFLKLGIGVFSMFIAIFFAFQAERYHVQLEKDTKIKAPFWLCVSSVGMGGISGALSIGIGDILIPIMRGKLKVPMQNAVGTALLLNFVVAFSGGVSHLFFAENVGINLWHAFGYSAIGVAFGGQIGGFLSSRLDESRLKEMFIFLLMLIGIHMIYQAL